MRSRNHRAGRGKRKLRAGRKNGKLIEEVKEVDGGIKEKTKVKIRRKQRPSAFCPGGGRNIRINRTWRLIIIMQCERNFKHLP